MRRLYYRFIVETTGGGGRVGETKQDMDYNKLMSKEKTIATVVGGGAMLAGATAFSILGNNHNALTHDSLDLDPWLQNAARLEQALAGANDISWAATHRIHHRAADVNGGAILDYGERLIYCLENNIPTPDTHTGLDLCVPYMLTDEVLELYGHAREDLSRNMPDYEPCTQFAEDEIRAGFDPQARHFEYGPRHKFWKKGESLDPHEKAHKLITDPHSTALTRRIPGRPNNPIRRMFMENLARTMDMGKFWQLYPELMDEDLRPLGPLSNNKKMQVAGFAIPAAVVLAGSRDFTPRGVARAAAIGSMINLEKLATLAAGVNFVNSVGHSGDPGDLKFWQILFKAEYEIVPQPSGKLSTKIANNGVAARVANAVTGDQVFYQDAHHREAGAVAYGEVDNPNITFLENPIGRTFEMLADNPHVPGIHRGAQFGLGKGERRPDDASPMTEMVERLRRERHPKIRQLQWAGV